MNRLTIEQLEYYRNTYDKYEGIESNEFDNICNELIEYKNLEEQLGCPLEVVFKALKDRQVIFKHIVGLENPKITLKAHKISGLLFDGKNYGLWLYDNGYGDDEFYVYTKDYGKTWSLDKQTLEVMN